MVDIVVQPGDFSGTDNGDFIICGLVGVAGVVGAKEEKIVKELLIVDSLRGVDSTGIAVVPRAGGDVKLAKKLGHAYELIEHRYFNQALGGLHRAIIGHNRWGTIGRVSSANAHPFDFEGLVGAHNGTLTSKWKFKDNLKFDTDSEAMYNHLDQHGLKNLMGNMAGAWAMTWWDKEEETINFLRNKERPLWLIFSEDGNQLFWASELWMLKGVLDRNGVKTKEAFPLGEDVHLSITIDTDGVMEKPHAVNMPATLAVLPVYHQQQQPNYFRGNSGNVNGGATNVLQINEAKLKKEGVVPGTAVPRQNQTQLSQSGYGGSKTVLLSVLSLVENDGYGSSYLSCHDAKQPFAKIRWYYGRYTKADDMIGEEIIADISEMVIRMNDPAYFKVIDSSAVLVDAVGDSSGAAAVADSVDIEVDSVVEEASEEAEQVEEYEDARGRMLDFNGWMQKHGECTFCSDVVLPTDRHAFNGSYQIFCHTCMENDDCTQYTSFQKVVEKAASPF